MSSAKSTNNILYFIIFEIFFFFIVAPLSILIPFLCVKALLALAAIHLSTWMTIATIAAFATDFIINSRISIHTTAVVDRIFPLTALSIISAMACLCFAETNPFSLFLTCPEWAGLFVGCLYCALAFICMGALIYSVFTLED